MLRPGRLDKLLYVPLPTSTGRYLRVSSRGTTLFTHMHTCTQAPGAGEARAQNANVR